MQTTTKPSLPSIKFLLEGQQDPLLSHVSNGSSGLTMATSSPTKALIDVTKSGIAQYHFPSKDQLQPMLNNGSLPSIQHDIHSLSASAPSHGLPPHGHTRSYSDSTPYRQRLDFELPQPSHASYSSSNPFVGGSPSYLSPHTSPYPYNNSPTSYQYQTSRQNLSPPLATPPPHMSARPRPNHNHSRSMSDYTHPYASSLPNEPAYLSPPHHEPIRDKSHRFTPSHRRGGSASTIDYMLNNTHISPTSSASRPAVATAEPARYTSPIPSTNSNHSAGATSQDDDPEMEESSSNDGGSHSERSDSPSPPGKDAQGADQNRYVCTYCSKRFSRPSSLRIHTYSHTGEKPFVCTEEGCGRKFSVQSNMRRHLRVHRMGRTVKKVRYDGEVEGVRGNNNENGSGHARVNSGSSAESTGASHDRDDGGLRRSGTI